MTQFFVPPKNVRAPELLIPGRRPIGPVEVDWTHLLAKGLTSFVMPVGQGVLHNVVSNELIQADYSDGKYKPIQHYGQGIAAEATLDSWKITTAAEVNKALRGLHKMQDDGLGTVLVHWYKTSGGGGDTYPYIFSARNGSSGQRTYIINNNAGATVASYSWDNYTISPVFSTSDDTLYTMAITVDSSNESFYMNGELQDSRAGGGSIARSTNLGLLGQAFVSPTSSQNDVYGGFFFFATWDRELTAKEQKAIHENPYQLLKPAGT